MDIASWLPWTGIILIDIILGFLYLVAGFLLGIFACGCVFFILAILVMTCYIWIPILAIVIIIMKLCGF